MKLLFGTKNISKIRHLQGVCHGLPFEIQGIPSHLEDVEETGNYHYENARLKASYYYSQIKQPVFSCDSGLYFDEVTDEEQPGIKIRRPYGDRLTDDQMIEYYSNLAKKYGGRLTARYRNAICLVVDQDHIYEYAGLDIGSEPFYIVDKPHDIRREGFPLDSLSVDMDTGDYYLNRQASRVSDSTMNQGFIDFFKRTYKRPRVSLTFKGFDPIVIDLYPEYAPETCKNFISLIESGYYDDKSLCRSVPKRLIQSGDTSLDPKAWTDDSPGYILEGEFNRQDFKNPLSFKRGVLGMAMAAYEKTDYATAGSFFIMTKDESALDAIVPAFGMVVEGMDQVDLLNDLEVHEDYGYHAPCQPVAIEAIQVETHGYTYGTPKQVDPRVLE